MNCPKCGDKVDMNAGHVCLTGNDRLKERITYLQARITELERQAIIWHKYPAEKPKNGHYCLCLFYDMEYMIEQYIYDEFSDAIDQSEITHWAYLPRPPREEQ